MSPAFERDDLLSTHSFPTDGRPLSASQSGRVARASTQMRARLLANVHGHNAKESAHIVHILICIVRKHNEKRVN